MPAEIESEIRIQSPTLARFVTALLEGAGVARPLASQWTASLVWANLRGVDSHGVLRVPRYVELLKRKSINPSPNMKVERRAGAIVASTVAVGQLMSARAARRDVPRGWGIDAQGHDTTDSAKVATLLPMAGPKGSGLSFMIECLCSLTVHNPIVARALEAGEPWT